MTAVLLYELKRGPRQFNVHECYERKNIFYGLQLKMEEKIDKIDALQKKEIAI